jgi:hypothetical protein
MALELQAILHKEGTFDKEGSSISLQQELIYIYKKLYDIKMGFTFTHATRSESRLLYPQIIYKNVHVHRNQIYYFLKKLILNTKDSVLSSNEDLEDIIEKEILVDMQYLLIYFHLLSQEEAVFLKALSFMYQPIVRFREVFKEENLKKEISRQFQVTSKYECFDRIKKINDNIEEFLMSFDTTKVSLKHPLLLLIHSNYIVLKKILGNHVRKYYY